MASFSGHAQHTDEPSFSDDSNIELVDSHAEKDSSAIDPRLASVNKADAEKTAQETDGRNGMGLSNPSSISVPEKLRSRRQGVGNPSLPNSPTISSPLRLSTSAEPDGSDDTEDALTVADDREQESVIGTLSPQENLDPETDTCARGTHDTLSDTEAIASIPFVEPEEESSADEQYHPDGEPGIPWDQLVHVTYNSPKYKWSDEEDLEADISAGEAVDALDQGEGTTESDELTPQYESRAQNPDSSPTHDSGEDPSSPQPEMQDSSLSSEIEYSDDAHSPTLPDSTPIDDFDALPDITVDGVEELTGLDQARGLAMAEEYEASKPKIGPEQLTETVPEHTPAEYLSRSREQLILEHESTSIDSHIQPSQIRLGIQIHDEAERGRITRAYLHKYRTDFRQLCQMYDQLLNQKSALVGERIKLLDEQTRLKGEFQKLSNGLFAVYEERDTFEQELHTAAATKLELELRLHDAEENNHYFETVQIPDWKDTLRRYNHAATAADQRAAQASALATRMQAWAEHNADLAEAVRRREEIGTRATGTQTDAGFPLPPSLPHSSSASPHPPRRTKSSPSPSSSVRIAALTQQLRAANDEKSRYNALLNEWKRHIESAAVADTQSASVTAATGGRVKLTGSADKGSSVNVSPPGSASASASAPRPIKKRWCARETELKKSRVFRRNLEGVRQRQRQQQQQQTPGREVWKEDEKEYARLQGEAYRVLHAGAERPYVCREDGLAELRAIVRHRVPK